MANRSRSLAKSLSYRFTGSLVTGCVVWFSTGKIHLALGAGAVEVVVKLFLYYAHERAWDHIKWGRH